MTYSIQHGETNEAIFLGVIGCPFTFVAVTDNEADIYECGRPEISVLDNGDDRLNVGMKLTRKKAEPVLVSCCLPKTDICAAIQYLESAMGKYDPNHAVYVALSGLKSRLGDFEL